MQHANNIFNAIEDPICLDKNTETFINNSANVYNKNTRDKKEDIRYEVSFKFHYFTYVWRKKNLHEYSQPSNKFYIYRHEIIESENEYLFCDKRENKDKIQNNNFVRCCFWKLNGSKDKRKNKFPNWKQKRNDIGIMVAMNVRPIVRGDELEGKNAMNGSNKCKELM